MVNQEHLAEEICRAMLERSEVDVAPAIVEAAFPHARPLRRTLEVWAQNHGWRVEWKGLDRPMTFRSSEG